MARRNGASDGASTRDRNQPRVSANTKRDIDIDLGPKRGIQPREAGMGESPTTKKGAT